MTLPDMSPRFEAVCHTEHARLLRYLRSRVGPDEAPDLVQEAFARLMGARNPERIENPAAYLSRITRNMMINSARKRQGGERKNVEEGKSVDNRYDSGGGRNIKKQ